MASPKIPRLMMQSMPGGRLRSPGPTRKSDDPGNDITARMVKKSRRSKSSECSSREPDTPGTRRRANKEEQSQSSDQQSQNSLEKRWKIMTKNVDKMSREEILGNFRLLLNDHLKLEKFLSFITREHEVSRNRMESDLLDAMMYIEELKQALEVRMTRRARVDPREAEERRSLIRQNKKLLKQLYESAKRIEKLEATVAESKEQLELMEFQMMESENQKLLVEEQLQQQQQTVSQVDEEVQTGAYGCDQSDVRVQQMEELIRKLKRENADLRDQLATEEENSLAESDKSVVSAAHNLRIQLQQKEQVQNELERKIKFFQQRCRFLEDALRKATSEGNQSDTSGGGDPDIESQVMADTGDVKVEGATAAVLTDENGENDDVDYFADTTAMSHLLQSSFFSLTSMVPLDEKVMVHEKVPEKMKEKEDTLLGETIRTFQSLVADKENEIAELKARLKELGFYSSQGKDIKFTDIVCQTEMDMTDCDILERQMDCLEKENEKIKFAGTHQLEILEKCEKLDAQQKVVDQDLDEIYSSLQNAETGSSNNVKYQDKSIEDKVCTLAEICASMKGKLSEQTAALDTIKPQLDEEIQKNKDLEEKLSVAEKVSAKRIAELEIQTSTLQENMQPEPLVKTETESHKKSFNEENAMLKGKIEQLEKDNNRWKSYVDHMGQSDSDALRSVSALEEALRESQSKERALRTQLEQDIQTHTRAGDTKGKDGDEKTARYYSLQLQELRHETALTEAQARLAYSERRRNELERRVGELEDELMHARRTGDSLEANIVAARRMEASLKRRIEALELRQDKGSSTGSAGRLAELEAKMAHVESLNTSLTEASKLDRSRLHESSVRARELDAEKRAMSDKYNDLQAREICAQKKILRLQAIYEDMLREYAEVKSHDVTWRKRARGYEELESDLRERFEAQETAMRVLQREKNRLDSRLVQANEEIRNHKESIDDLQLRLTDRENKYLEMKQVLDQMEVKCAEATEQLQDSEARILELERMNSRRRGSSLNRVEGGGPDRRYLEQRLVDTERSEQQLRTKVRQLEEAEQCLRARVLQMESGRYGAFSKMSGSSDGHEVLQQALRSRERDLEEAKAEIRRLKDEVDEAKALAEARSNNSGTKRNAQQKYTASARA